MFVAGHAVAGALIAYQIPEHAYLVFLLAFVSHFLLDLIPHGDAHHVKDYYKGSKTMLRELYNSIIADTLATIILVAILFAYTPLNKVALAWGIIGAVLPDLIVAIDESISSKRLTWFTKLHFRFHEALTDKFPVKMIPGAIGQIILIAGFFLAM